MFHTQGQTKRQVKSTNHIKLYLTFLALLTEILIMMKVMHLYGVLTNKHALTKK